MKNMPTTENAATWFNAKTVTHHLDVVDRQAEDGRLYAILEDDDDDDRTREEPVGPLPFADVQVGPNCEFGRRITAVAVEYGPATVTVSLIAPFAELVTATRPYSEDEADYLL